MTGGTGKRFNNVPILKILSGYWWTGHLTGKKFAGPGEITSMERGSPGGCRGDIV
jgi:hypothetical protein